MNEIPETTLTVGTNTDNVIQNFQLDHSSLRGRMVRLGSELDDIIKAHNYPEIVNQLLSETLALAVTLASMLKYDGIFTLQIQTKGPISMLVADKTSDGHIRACATYDSDALETLLKKTIAQKRDPLKLPLSDVLGTGYMAFTVDQGPDTERYQGIVELKGDSLVESVQHYFNQSEQIGSGIKMACGKVDGAWRAGVIMLQHMPEDEIDIDSGSGNFIEDDWRRTMILLGSCKNEELISAQLDSQELLYRLFHEELLRVFEPKFVEKQCRCERDRLVSTIRMMPQEDRDHIFKGDTAIVKCEFCSKDYTIKHDEL
mgnify:CR=1 FL=1|tara:strand:- start:49693 stop:50637 length:945 start_codon:yes stop_codon:yes gene_type:complete